jgi:hypothetical protein
MINKIWINIRPFMLPLLLAVYPSLFLYSNNAAITLLSSLIRLLWFNALLALVVYLISLLINKFNAWRGSISASVFLFYFNIYGMVFNFLYKRDFIRIEHYTLLPLFILLTFYSVWAIVKINNFNLHRIWNIASFIMIGLIIINLIKITPAEIEKRRDLSPVSMPPPSTSISRNPTYPDIYFIILDEFSGFEPMREYWHYQGVDDFKQFLENNHFFVAEQSHGESQETLHELATRLNFQEYPCCDQLRTYFSAIADNRVMRFLKTKGYTTITFDESESAFPTDLPIKSDYYYGNAPDTYNSYTIIDNFDKLVIDNTMLRIFSNLYDPLIEFPSLKAHIDMLSFTLDKMNNLEVASPKFVYVHVLLPHMPFIFDSNGFVIASYYNTNWDDYLDNYIYAIKYAEKMITNILSHADPQHPPIIILQSDHGARNQIYNGNEEHLLKNFPERFKTSILFALHVPGLDTSTLPQDINPINTFPLIFNYLFNSKIPMQ